MNQPKEGSLAPRPTPEPRIIHCPACGFQHVDEGEWASKPHTRHRCAACDRVWSEAGHATIGVTEEDLDRMRLIHEQARMEAALEHYGFPARSHTTESSFDRMLDALMAAEGAGHELEAERDTALAQLAETRQCLDSITGFLLTTLSDCGLDDGLTPAEKRMIATADRLVERPTERAEFEKQLAHYRAHSVLAAATLRSTLREVLSEQIDDETGEVWTSCELCCDSVEPDHADDPQDCPIYGLARLLERLEAKHE